MQVKWLLNGCEQAINHIQEVVRQATTVQKLGQIANTNGMGILMI